LIPSSLSISKPEAAKSTDAANLTFTTYGLATMREKIVEEYFPSYLDIDFTALYDISQDELDSIKKYDPVGFPPVMGSSPNPSFHVLGLRPRI
jgi:hypothetical protein